MVFRQFHSFRVHSVHIVGVLFLLLMISAVFIGIVFRYVIQRPIMWIEEFARFMFIWNIYIGAIIASREKNHPQIDYFVNLLPEKPRNIILAGVRVLLSLTGIMLIWQGTKLAIKFRLMTSIAMGIPWAIMYAVVPITFTVIVLEDGLEFYSTLKQHHLQKKPQIS